MIVYAVVDDALSPDFPLGVELEVFVRREDAGRFIEEVRGDEPRVTAKLRIEERKLEAGGRANQVGAQFSPRQVRMPVWMATMATIRATSGSAHQSPRTAFAARPTRIASER